MTITEYETDSESDVTPSDLKAMRIRLGLDMSELAQLLGLAGRRDVVENLEKARTWTMHQEHADALTMLEGEFDDVLNEMSQEDDPEFLIGFPNDGVFAEMEPGLHQRLRFNSVHRMLLALRQASVGEMEQDESGRTRLIGVPQIVEIIPARYNEWLRGRSDSPGNRIAWAREHVKVYRIKPGLPRLGEREP